MPLLLWVSDMGVPWEGVPRGPTGPLGEVEEVLEVGEVGSVVGGGVLAAGWGWVVPLWWDKV